MAAADPILVVENIVKRFETEDGVLTAAAQEERFTRIKHDSAYPENAIAFCLKQGQVAGKDLDYVVFYDKPFLKFERILETHLAVVPRNH